MTQRVETFETGAAPRIYFRLPSGEARVVAGESDSVTVRLSGSEAALSRFIVEKRGDTVYIEPERGRWGRWSSVELVIEAGDSAQLEARLAAGDLAVTIGVASLIADSASGDIVAGSVKGDVAVKSASGDVRIGEIDGTFEAAAASGDIRAASVGGDLFAKTAAGDVEVDAVGGEVRIKSASGDVHIGSFAGPDLDVKTLSGDVSVGVVGGRRFEVSFQALSGDVRTEFPVTPGRGESGPTGRLNVKSMSGDISIHPAPEV